MKLETRIIFIALVASIVWLWVWLSPRVECSGAKLRVQHFERCMQNPHCTLSPTELRYNAVSQRIVATRCPKD